MIRRNGHPLMVLLLIAAVCGCITSPAFTATGQASWYGPGYAGRPTASGERFDPGALTAAHPSLPLGTRVRVTYLKTGRSVVVRINDRFGGHKGRIIDLSEAAAARIGLKADGVGRVGLEILE